MYVYIPFWHLSSNPKKAAMAPGITFSHNNSKAGKKCLVIIVAAAAVVIVVVIREKSLFHKPLCRLLLRSPWVLYVYSSCKEGWEDPTTYILDLSRERRKEGKQKAWNVTDEPPQWLLYQTNFHPLKLPAQPRKGLYWIWYHLISTLKMAPHLGDSTGQMKWPIFKPQT